MLHFRGRVVNLAALRAQRFPSQRARSVFVTGATGYLGRALIPVLLSRGHGVCALARKGSEARVPAGARVVIGDALDASSFATRIAPANTLVHLVGTPHPSPAKAASFRSVDLRSVQAAVEAARQSGIRHFVYLSVAQPAPVMASYIAVRQAGEALIHEVGMAATILRPWYVLGPGHRWPILLQPVYALLCCFAATRDSAQRLGLVTLAQMVRALVAAVEREPEGYRVLSVPDIRSAAVGDLPE